MNCGADQQHRPTDPAQIDAEICRLSDSGLMVRDVASALKVNPSVVVQALTRRALIRSDQRKGA